MNDFEYCRAPSQPRAIPLQSACDSAAIGSAPTCCPLPGPCPLLSTKMLASACGKSRRLPLCWRSALGICPRRYFQPHRPRRPRLQQRRQRRQSGSCQDFDMYVFIPATNHRSCCFAVLVVLFTFARTLHFLLNLC